MFSAPAYTASKRLKQFAGAYQQVGVQTLVDQASPHTLVAMLFEGFIAAVNRAKGALETKDIQTKCDAIMQAARIIDEGLRPALNVEAGGPLAADLRDLYTYICMRLTLANVRNDPALLDECLSLIRPIQEAWAAIAPSAAPSTQGKQSLAA